MSYRLSFGGFDDHATAIGYVCITWGLLESVIDELVAILCRIPMLTDESRVLTSNIEFRRKLQILAAQAFLKKPSPEWFEDIHWLATVHIDNNLRNRRNRFVHDQWDSGDEGWRKRQQAAKFIKPEARTIELITQTLENVSADQIWELVREIQEASVALNLMKIALFPKQPPLPYRQMIPRIPGSPWTTPDRPPERKRAKPKRRPPPSEV